MADTRGPVPDVRGSLTNTGGPLAEIEGSLTTTVGLLANIGNLLANTGAFCVSSRYRKPSGPQSII